MNKAILLASTLVASTAATPAFAADFLTSASITGISGAAWNTTQDAVTTLFLQAPRLGDFLNADDQPINARITGGGNGFLLAGDGTGTGILDSDLIYNLTLNFQSGNTLTGSYTPTTNTFIGGSSYNFENRTYSLAEFSFRRNLGDSVSQFSADPGDNANDYNGNFRINASPVVSGAVPEPATWAMMIAGFGFVGGTMRRRRSTHTRQIA